MFSILPIHRPVQCASIFILFFPDFLKPSISLKPSYNANQFQFSNSAEKKLETSYTPITNDKLRNNESPVKKQLLTEIFDHLDAERLCEGGPDLGRADTVHAKDAMLGQRF